MSEILLLHVWRFSLRIGGPKSKIQAESMEVAFGDASLFPKTCVIQPTIMPKAFCFFDIYSVPNKILCCLWLVLNIDEMLDIKNFLQLFHRQGGFILSYYQSFIFYPIQFVPEINEFIAQHLSSDSA